MSADPRDVWPGQDAEPAPARIGRRGLAVIAALVLAFVGAAVAADITAGGYMTNLVGGVYYTTVGTLTDRQPSPLTMTTDKRVRVDSNPTSGSTMGIDYSTTTAASVTATASTSSDFLALGASAGRRYLGFSIKESAGTPAACTLVIRDGTSTAGTPIDFVNLAPSESAREWYGIEGKSAANGIFVDFLTGTATVEITYK